MKKRVFVYPVLALWGAVPMVSAAEVSTLSLLEEMADLARLARTPTYAFRTVQYSSYDRRSTHPDAPGWYSNSDGFGGEAIPNFAAVLRKPDAEGIGLYLVADVEGPGAVVRGWSAGMGGTLRVFLDNMKTPVWEKSAYDFMARRSRHYLEEAGLSIEAGDAFEQQDADYLPMPFAKRLRVTYEGRVDRLHFYHLQVRLYEKRTPIRTFDAKKDLRAAGDTLQEVIAALTDPRAPEGGETHALHADLPAGETWTWTHAAAGEGEAITALSFNVRSKDLLSALRGVLLRITFDKAGRPQVESPIGDFFATGPGVNPHASFPITVQKDGTMECRFVMPFQSAVRVELRNTTASAAVVDGGVTLAPWTWDARSLYFRAKWRVDHDLVAGGGAAACDMPYVIARGEGILVGLATMIVNPSRVPSSHGNWWGEGDEKIFVDDEPVPSTFGTGSEDYYNYSWSRPDLFDHPFCGQPLDSGPANAGYVSNHRWQILDAIPFKRNLAVYMELWHHTTTPGLSYARTAYLYARPGCIDDHRRLMPSDCIVPKLPRWEPIGRLGSSNSVFHNLEDLKLSVSHGKVERVPCDIASRGRVSAWSAKAGQRLTISFSIERSGVYLPNLVGLHQVAGASFKALLDGKPLPFSRREGAWSLKTDFHTRLLNVSFHERFLEAGQHTLTLTCIEPGRIGGDYLWLRSTGRKVSGAIEAERWEVIALSEEVEVEHQAWPGSVFSEGRQAWIKAKKKGDSVEFRVPNPKPGRREVKVYFTKSWDYGILRFLVNGSPAGEAYNAFSPRSRGVTVQGPVSLGVHTLGETFRLKVTVVGFDPRSIAPHFYCGLDCLVLEDA